MVEYKYNSVIVMPNILLIDVWVVFLRMAKAVCICAGQLYRLTFRNFLKRVGVLTISWDC